MGWIIVELPPLRVRDVAKELGVSMSTVRNLVRRGLLDCQVAGLGRGRVHVRVKRKSLDLFMEKIGRTQSTERT